MSGFLVPPTFRPPVYGIPLGTPGQVLTMSGGVPVFATPSAGGLGGTYLAYASAAGTSNNVNPAGFGGGVGLLDVSLTGDATWTGLAAGSDRQMLVIANASSLHNLTLAALNAGSAAANQFRATGDAFLPPLAALLVVYYTTPAVWIVA